MLDVHPPHHATHSWRDFFIHIATITVGLLIAIGLEQSVEAIHRAHERRVLIDALQAECKTNAADLEKIIENRRARVLVLRSWIAALREAQPTAGSISVQLPSDTSAYPLVHTPSRSAWAAAKASGKVALLPDNLTEVYGRVDFEAQGYEEALRDRHHAIGEIVYFGVRAGQPIKDGATLHLSLAQRDELELLVSELARARQDELVWAAEWIGASRAVLDGVKSRDAMWKYIEHAGNNAEIE